MTAQPVKIQRTAHLRWIPLAKMKVSSVAQRECNPARVDRIVANFDPEQIGSPVVNEREGWFYILDGQHRIAAMREIGWGDQQVQCWTYVGLTEEEEAEVFLKLNDVLPVKAMEKFTVGIAAGRPEEIDIDRIVRAQGLHVTSDKQEGAIRAVGTLRRVYNRDGASSLGRALRIIRDSYGSPGLEAPVIDGIGLLCGRYNGQLDENAAVKMLASASGGVNGLLGKAQVERKQTRRPLGQCVAAAAVDLINRGRGGKKLPSWWRDSS